jgi:hypothetical protein
MKIGTRISQSIVGPYQISMIKGSHSDFKGIVYSDELSKDECEALGLHLTDDYALELECFGECEAKGQRDEFELIISEELTVFSSDGTKFITLKTDRVDFDHIQYEVEQAFDYEEYERDQAGAAVDRAMDLMEDR